MLLLLFTGGCDWCPAAECPWVDEEPAPLCVTGAVLGGLVAEGCLVGDQIHGRAGYALVMAGDLDADGAADLVVTAPQAQVPDLAYLAPVDIVGIAALSPTAVRVAEPDDPAPGALGTAVAAAGDVDGDGVPDLWLGAPDGLEDGSGYAGWVPGPVAYRGRISAVQTRLIGITPYAGTGHAVVGLGDHHGDGAAEVAVSAPFEGDGRGVVYVASGPFEPGDVPLWSVSERVSGTADGHEAGTSLSAGDVDGDGLLDLAIGAPGALGGGGRAAIFLAPVPDGLAVADADHRVGGTGASGAQLALGGDLDGDGLADLVVSAPEDGRVADHAGSVAIHLSPPSDEPDGLLTGQRAGDRVGTTLATDLDLDGDGRDDVVFGAPHAPVGPQGESGPGVLWLAWGTPLGTTAVDTLDSTSGHADGDAFSQGLAAIPGGGGDGRDALAVGAWGALGDAEGAGVVWLFR